MFSLPGLPDLTDSVNHIMEMYCLTFLEAGMSGMQDHSFQTRDQTHGPSPWLAGGHLSTVSLCGGPSVLHTGTDIQKAISVSPAYFNLKDLDEFQKNLFPLFHPNPTTLTS